MGVCTDEMSPHSSKHELVTQATGATVGGLTSSTAGGYRKRF